jgi:imidazoleglycerol phosphate synthase glutamine amidotransferase subunit HisH
LCFELDADEEERDMERVLMDLARYGKLGVPGPHLGWDDVEVRQVHRLHRHLADMLKREGAAAGAED